MAVNNSLPTQNCLLSIDFDYHNVTNAPNYVKTSWVVFAAINGLAAPPTILINIVIIWVILKNESLQSSIYNNVLVALAVTDLLVGLLMDPMGLWFYLSVILRRPSVCFMSAYASFGILFSSWTICTFTVACLERYLAIEHPQFYLEKVTTRKVITITFVLWLVAPTFLLTGRILLDDSETFRKIPLAFFYLSNSIVIVYCTVKVSITARRHRRSINVVQAIGQPELQEEERKRVQEIKLAITTSILLLASFIFYSPYIIIGIIQSIKGNEDSEFLRYLSVPVGTTFLHLQSLVNPFIMTIRLSYMREEIKKTFSCCTLYQ